MTEATVVPGGVDWWVGKATMTVNQFSGCVRLPTQGVARINLYTVYSNP